MEQVRENGTIGALYMNGEVIPADQGFPLRILNPGYFGVKQPANNETAFRIGQPTGRDRSL